MDSLHAVLVWAAVFIIHPTTRAITITHLHRQALPEAADSDDYEVTVGLDLLACSVRCITEGSCVGLSHKQHPSTCVWRGTPPQEMVKDVSDWGYWKTADPMKLWVLQIHDEGVGIYHYDSTRETPLSKIGDVSGTEQIYADTTNNRVYFLRSAPFVHALYSIHKDEDEEYLMSFRTEITGEIGAFLHRDQMFFAMTDDDVYSCNITNCTSPQRLFLDKDGCDPKRIGLHRTQRVLYVFCQYADESHAILRMSFYGNDRKTFFTLNNPLICAFVNQEGSYSYVYVCDQSSATKYSLDGAAVKGFKIPVDKTGDLRERVCREMVAGDSHIYTIFGANNIIVFSATSGRFLKGIEISFETNYGHQTLEIQVDN